MKSYSGCKSLGHSGIEPLMVTHGRDDTNLCESVGEATLREAED